MKMLFFTVLLLLPLSVFGDDNYEELFDQISDTTSDNTSDIPSIDKSPTKNPFLAGLKASLVGTHIFELHVPVIKDHMNFDGYIKSPKFRNDFGVEVRFKMISLISHWQFDLILNQWGEGAKLLELIPQENYLSFSPWKFFLR